jgi:hypothetical protein
MLKTKRSATFYVTIITAAIMPVIFLIDMIVDGPNAETRKDPLNAVFKMGLEVLTLAFLPMFVIAVCTLLPQIEYRNNTWKQVYASPQTKANVFVAKFLLVQMLLLLLLLSFNVLMASFCVIGHFIAPELNMLNQPFNSSAWADYNVNAYVAVLAISTIQFWLGLRFKNFIIPMAVGLAMWVTGILLIFEFKPSYVNLFPYSYSALSVLPKYKQILPTVQLYSAGYAALFLVLGFIHFRYKNVKA